MIEQGARRRLPGAALALLLAVVPARAATLRPLDSPPDTERRPFELHPYASYSEAYDSNIYLLPQAISSWIQTLGAGVRALGSYADKHRFDLSYDLADRIYSYSKDSGAGNQPIQELNGIYRYKAPSGLGLRLQDDYLNTIDPANTELTGLRRRWDNLARAEAAYEPEERRVALGVDAQELRRKYVAEDPAQRQLLDRYVQLVGGRLGWQAQPKTVAYVAYHRELIHYTDRPDPSRDSKGNLVDFGLEGDLMHDLTGTAQVGLVERRYDGPPAPGQGSDTRNFTSLISLNYQRRERTRSVLKVSRSLEESGYNVNQYYIATGGTLAITHDFPWKLSGTISGGYEVDKYPTTTLLGPLAFNRLDQNYSAGADLALPIGDHWRVAASYLYRARFSRGLSEQFNYRDHLTAGTVTVTF